MFKVGDIVYIPNSDRLLIERRKWIYSNIARITRVERKANGYNWYNFEFLHSHKEHKYFHTGYDHNNLADKTWIKVNGNLKIIEILYGKV